MATGSIEVNSTKKTGTITPKSGFTVAEDRCVQRGDVVEVHCYVSGTFSANTETAVVQISGVTLPPKAIRYVCGYGAHAYDSRSTGYCGLFTSGNIEVNIPSSASVVTIDFVYTV